MTSPHQSTPTTVYHFVTLASLHQDGASSPLRSNDWARPLANFGSRDAKASGLWANDSASVLTSQSTVYPLQTGNGLSIYKSTIIPILLNAKHEIILVTCFWARSETLSGLCSLLKKLNEDQSARPPDVPKLRIRLCFSSLSLLQKLFHTQSPKGHIRPPSTWSSKLGLPSLEQIPNLDLQVKSIFFKPFSVLHPKYVIVDWQLAFFPSCNISWENWLECCLPVTGPVVETLLRGWREVWADGFSGDAGVCPSFEAGELLGDMEGGVELRTTLIPSPHHINPRFHPWPLQAPTCPTTPLNIYLLHLFQNAKRHIQILTPNVTASPVVQALKDAIERGVNVTIITNRKMMVLEQLFTAGTVTEICMIRLRRWHRLQDRHRSEAIASLNEQDLEQGVSHSLPQMGNLRIGYFIGQEGREVKCHIKCTVIDEKVMVLGSGNMDRASWYTSQELGIAVEGEGTVKEMWSAIEGGLQERVEKWYGW